MNWVRDFGKWALAMIREWLIWLAGGVVAVMGLGHALEWWNPKPSHYAIVIVAGFVLSAFHVWRFERVAKEKLIHPVFDFLVEPKRTPQKDPSQHAIYHRIAVTNVSPPVVACKCRLLIESWSFSCDSLSSDTPLDIKDEHPRKIETDINQGDTKQFDLFITRLVWDTNDPEFTVVCAPNYPVINNGPGAGKEILLRLTGENFSPQRFRVLVIVEGKQVRITRIDKI
jgi:hypothetical protein